MAEKPYSPHKRVFTVRNTCATIHQTDGTVLRVRFSDLSGNTDPTSPGPAHASIKGGRRG